MQGHTVSSWWEFDFSIVGKAELIETVKAEIFAARAEDEQPFFDYLHLVHEAAGFLVVHAGRNYGGCDPLLDLAEKYPDLAFAGNVEHEDQFADGSYFIVRAHAGYQYAHKLEYDEHDPNGRLYTAEDAKKCAADYNEKILWLAQRREACRETFTEVVPDIVDVIKAWAEEKEKTEAERAEALAEIKADLGQRAAERGELTEKPPRRCGRSLTRSRSARRGARRHAK